MIVKRLSFEARRPVNARMALLVASIALVILASCGSRQAHTGPPVKPTSSDRNGKIAFVVPTNSATFIGTIFVMNPDGTGARKLPTKPVADQDPAWSPDGSKLAFEARQHGNTDIYLMNSDGSGLRRLTTEPTAEEQPSWSPDGTRMAFWRGASGPAATGDIYTMKVDSTDPRQLTNSPRVEAQPTWSTDGKKIAFSTVARVHGPERSDIYTMSPDGTNRTNLTHTPGADEWDPSWSPDGKKIAFDFVKGDWQEGDIYTMDVDGTDRTNLTETLSELAQGPEYSPNGVKIAFSSMYNYGQFQIFEMDADGTDIHTVEDDPPTYEINPDWQPIPRNH